MNSNRENIKLRKSIFFYAEDDVEHYDSDANLNTPRYDDLIGMLNSLSLNLISERLSSQKEPFVVVDIGSGTGACSLNILNNYPQVRVIAVDICPPMHDVYQRKAQELFGSESVLERIRFVSGDIITDDALKAIRAAVRDLCGGDMVHAIVSGLALHHLDLKEKMLLYPRLRELLVPNGFFANADLFGYHNKYLNDLAQTHTLSWIDKQHTLATTDYPEKVLSLGKHAEDLKRKWIDHCVKYNILLPLEQDRESQIAGDLCMLEKSGFSKTICWYRWWQTAVALALP